MNRLYIFFGFYVVSCLQVFSAGVPSMDDLKRLEDYRKKLHLVGQLLDYKKSGSFSITMNPITGMPEDSCSLSDIEGAKMKDIRKLILGFEDYLYSEAVKDTPASVYIEGGLCRQDVAKAAELLYVYEDLTGKNERACPFIKSCFKRQDSRIKNRKLLAASSENQLICLQ